MFVLQVIDAYTAPKSYPVMLRVTMKINWNWLHVQDLVNDLMIEKKTNPFNTHTHACIQVHWSFHRIVHTGH